MGIKLSLLICTVPSRVHGLLPRLVTEVQRQLDAMAEHSIEMLYLGDNKMRSVGRKRNDLLEMAQGDYVCFLDDDDSIEPIYVSRIHAQLDGLADVICFMVDCAIDGGPALPVYYRKDFLKNSNLPGHYERLPNHLMVVKRELALRTKFADISRGEDKDYSMRLKPLLAHEVVIDEVLYHYEFNRVTTETQKQV